MAAAGEVAMEPEFDPMDLPTKTSAPSMVTSGDPACIFRPQALQVLRPGDIPELFPWVGTA